MSAALSTVPGELTLAAMRQIGRDGAMLDLTGDWRGKVEAAAATVARVVSEGRVVYGVNTGFGMLAQTRIPPDQLRDLQVRLVRSHSAGVGPMLPREAVRLILALKANSLARGYSGVRVAVVELFLAMLEREVLPRIPSQGSVGASGDLAPLAYLAAAAIGEGEVSVAGEVMSATDGLAKAGLIPLVLEPKEGLALLNGTQVSTALALLGLFAAEDVFAAALAAGALSVDAMKGSDTPFDPRISALRAHPGQEDVARTLRALLAGSQIRESHLDCERVQDPYSLRCQPQVMGACLDQMRGAAEVLAREANAVSDNPLVFAGDDEVLSGGNFHAEPVAMVADALAVAIAEIGALSERRVALLVDPKMSGLPAFLAVEPGINSGFMIPQVSAAALASENKGLAHPASVDSLPTSADQEDHVSMATYAARRLLPMAGNAAHIVAIELLAATQGLDFHRPHTTSPMLKPYYAALRERVPFYEEDRAFTGDIATVAASVLEGGYAQIGRAVPVPSRTDA